MKKRTHILAVLVDKYLRQKTTREEENLLDDFATSRRGGDEWDDQVLGGKEEVSQKIWRQIHTTIDHEESKVRPLYLSRYRISIAASVLLVLGLGLLVSRPWMSHTYLLSTGAAMDSVQMVDGSMIYLGAHSTLSYTSDYNETSRAITLKRGNAFFDVTKNPDKPFVIRSGAIETTVLGTSFNIEMEQEHYRVSVRTGKVRVASATAAVNLLPNQEAYFAKSTQHLDMRPISSPVLTQWFERDLALTKVSLEEVLAVLEYKFGVKSQVAHREVLDTQVTLHIPEGATLDQVIVQLNYITNNLKIEMHGEKITIE
ncbi:hypothetical protein BFP72_14125 [Reichenbachiella sp. 5M10]|uniref:FecR family protein n=1 Tax=Reichenbachiella sp. 5M10 TaxID=1889772 RepID=UPI000C1541FB|nr:FecR family protein [Reichenbachiella sp. 5M10]PIB36451.1 hypothetical protein BFP72_14125 [Reichenbachiella sp. 5M10]